jgi:hypothetical protein
MVFVKLWFGSIARVSDPTTAEPKTIHTDNLATDNSIAMRVKTANSAQLEFLMDRQENGIGRKSTKTRENRFLECLNNPLHYWTEISVETETGLS